MAEEAVTPLHMLMIAGANLLGAATTILHQKWQSRKRPHEGVQRRKEDPEITAIKQYLFGIDGNNGLRSDMVKLSGNVRKLDRKLESFEIAMVRFVASSNPDKLDHLKFDQDDHGG